MAVHETFQYDALGRVTLQASVPMPGTDTEPTSTAYEYDDTVDPPTVTKTITVGSLSSAPIETTYNHAGEMTAKSLPGGRVLEYDHNDAGQLSGVSSTAGGQTTPVATYKHVGARRASVSLGNNAVMAMTYYDTAQHGTRPTGTEHIQTGTSTTVDARTNTWDDNYNRTGRSITAGPAALQTSHTYTYDGLDRLEASDSESYTLDEAGNRTATSAAAYGFNGTGALLHQYATAPGGAAYGYDAAGRLASLTSDNRSYIYDAMGRLKEVRLDAGVTLSDMSDLPIGAETEEGAWDTTNDYLEETGSASGRILWPPPAGAVLDDFIQGLDPWCNPVRTERVHPSTPQDG